MTFRAVSIRSRPDVPRTREEQMAKAKKASTTTTKTPAKASPIEAATTEPATAADAAQAAKEPVVATARARPIETAQIDSLAHPHTQAALATYAPALKMLDDALDPAAIAERATLATSQAARAHRLQQSADRAHAVADATARASRADAAKLGKALAGVKNAELKAAFATFVETRGKALGNEKKAATRRKRAKAKKTAK